MKIDGIGGRFGKDSSSRPFFESSYSGPVFTSGSFVEYAKSTAQCDDILSAGRIQRAIHIDELFDTISISNIMEALPENTKIVCEIFYTAMAKHENDEHITFVHVAYNKQKIGKSITVMPYTVLEANTGNEHSDKEEILNILYSLSNEDIKIVNPNLSILDNIDISYYADEVSDITDQTLLFLKSRKHVIDIEIKKSLMERIQKVKNELAEYILYHPNIVDKYKLGEQIEGIVLWIDGIEYKITTSEFKECIKNERL
jgi:hypothetical protein